MTMSRKTITFIALAVALAAAMIATAFTFNTSNATTHYSGHAISCSYNCTYPPHGV